MSARRTDPRDKVLKNISAQGEVGAAWLAYLPTLVRKLEANSGSKVAQTFPNATEAYVAAVVTAHNEEVALKIRIRGIEKANREFRALQAANGRGYVRLAERRACDCRNP